MKQYRQIDLVKKYKSTRYNISIIISSITNIKNSLEQMYYLHELNSDIYLKTCDDYKKLKLKLKVYEQKAKKYKHELKLCDRMYNILTTYKDTKEVEDLYTYMYKICDEIKIKYNNEKFEKLEKRKGKLNINLNNEELYNSIIKNSFKRLAKSKKLAIKFLIEAGIFNKNGHLSEEYKCDKENNDYI